VPSSASGVSTAGGSPLRAGADPRPSSMSRTSPARPARPVPAWAGSSRLSGAWARKATSQAPPIPPSRNALATSRFQRVAIPPASPTSSPPQFRRRMRRRARTPPSPNTNVPDRSRTSRHGSKPSSSGTFRWAPPPAGTFSGSPTAWRLRRRPSTRARPWSPCGWRFASRSGTASSRAAHRDHRRRRGRRRALRTEPRRAAPLHALRHGSPPR
jgi:hypothetical protein